MKRTQTQPVEVGKMNRSDSFTFYPSFLPLIEGIKSDSVKLLLYQAIVRYGVSGEEPDFSSIDPLGLMDGIFSHCKALIDQAKENRKVVSEKRKSAVAKRYQNNSKSTDVDSDTQTLQNHTTVDNNPQTDTNSTNAYNCIQEPTIVSGKGKGNGKDKELSLFPNVKRDKGENAKMRFAVPSLSEIESFISENGYSVNPQTFYDFYQSKGWMVGKTPMKDWKASVRGWNSRENKSITPSKNQNGNTGHNNSVGFGLIE